MFKSRRGGREVYRAALEMRCAERHREFESHLLRQFSEFGFWAIVASPRLWRGEVELSFLQNSNWRCILKIARTEFCSHRALRGSEWAGGQNERRSREYSKLPKNLKTSRLEPYFAKGKRNFFIIHYLLSGGLTPPHICVMRLLR